MVSGDVLAALMLQNVNQELQKAGSKTVSGYQGPLASKNPSYFSKMCGAIGKGIVQGAPSLQFTTSDTGVMGTPPIPATGFGVGITVDGNFFLEEAYSKLRDKVTAKFGKTNLDPYPPTSMASGQMTEALLKGVVDSIVTYYGTAWNLSSVHSLVYMGTGLVQNGMFFGVIGKTVAQAIQSGTDWPSDKGWPLLCEAIGESYAEAIMQHSTAYVTIVGVCVPSPAQICGLPGKGVGTGSAA